VPRFLTPIVMLCLASQGWAQAAGTPELFPIVQYGKVGYIDRSGKIVIAPQFAAGASFSEGVAVVWVETPDYAFPLAGVIDPSGSWVIPPQFDRIGDFHEGFARAKLNDQLGTWVLLSRSGTVRRVPSRDVSPNSMSIGEVSEGLVSFSPTGDKFGFMDTAAALAIQPIYTRVRPFHEGLAAVCLEKCGFVDTHGQIVIPLKYEATLDFRKGRARVCAEEKCGYVSKTGLFTQSPDVFLLEELMGSHIAEYNADGRHAFYKHGQWGYVDDRARPVIKPEFVRAEEFSEGLAAVTIDEYGRCGYIDKLGKQVIPPVFSSCDQFTKGLAAIARFDATLGTSVAYITSSGRLVSLTTASRLALTQSLMPTKK
jgi:hypothetical protein